MSVSFISPLNDDSYVQVQVSNRFGSQHCLDVPWPRTEAHHPSIVLCGDCAIARSKELRSFYWVVALVGIASPFGDLGSGGLLVKNVSRNKSLFATYWGRGLVATAGAGSVLIAIVFLLSAFVLPSPR